jgi:putative membrane protein
MHWGYGFGWGALICGGGIALLLLLGLVALVIWLLTRSSSPGRSRGSVGPSSQTPLEILKTRYARGEISREEYEEMREHLTQ